MRKKIILYSLILILVTVLTGGCATTPEQPPYWPGDDWRTSTPEEQGLDSALILAMLQEIEQKKLPIHSVLIIRHGYLVTELYFPPYQQETKHPMRSVTKTITSALVGIAIQEDYIKSVTQNVLDFFPEIARDVKDKNLKDLTIEDLLTMSAGYHTDTLPNLDNKDASFDTVRHMLTYSSIIEKSGTSFYYDNGGPHLLSAIIQTTTGMATEVYAQNKFFGPLGITGITWGVDPQGLNTGYTGLTLSSRDMAKIGYLYLHHGRWNNTQIVPAQWVEASTTRHMETRGLMNAAEDDGYGYLWWIDSFGGYSAHGFGGQYIFVLPKLDMIVVFTGGLKNALFPAPHELVKTFMLPAAQSDSALTPNPQAWGQLEAEIKKIEHPEEKPVPPLPEVAKQISGKTFQITGNTVEGFFERVSLTFTDNNTYQLEMTWPQEQTELFRGNLNNTFYLNKVKDFQSENDMIFALKGYWQDDHTFIEEFIPGLSSDLQIITQKYTFDGKKITIDANSSLDLFSVQATGEMVE
jgi:CubicO group peptidase (beta-lactamase class C family)